MQWINNQPAVLLSVCVAVFFFLFCSVVHDGLNVFSSLSLLVGGIMMMMKKLQVSVCMTIAALAPFKFSPLSCIFQLFFKTADRTVIKHHHIIIINEIVSKSSGNQEDVKGWWLSNFFPFASKRPCIGLLWSLRKLAIYKVAICFPCEFKHICNSSIADWDGDEEVKSYL